MPVRGLEAELFRQDLIRSGQSLDSLRNCRIAIDANHWINKSNILKEPLQVAMGGMPIALDAIIAEEARKFKAAGITPVFVFSGLHILRKDPPRVNTLTSSVRYNAWEQYVSGRGTDAFGKLGRANTFELQNEIFRCLRHHGFEFFRAPYNSLAQLAYFTNNKQPLVHDIFCGFEMLIYNPKRFIVDIDFESNSFDLVDVPALLATLAVSHDQLVDACILAGHDNNIFSPLYTSQGEPFSNAIDMVRKFGSGVVAIQAHANNPNIQTYFESYLRARAINRHALIFDMFCKCDTLTRELGPSNLHEVIGPRFPNALYFCLFQGAISNQVINNLVSGYQVENAPLIDSAEYRRMLDELIPMRTRTLNLVSSCLTDYFKNRKVALARVFFDSPVVPLEHSIIDQQSPIPELLRIRRASLNAELKRRNCTPDKIDINFMLKWFNWMRDQSQPLESETIAYDTVNDSETQTVQQFAATVILQAMQYLDYITPDLEGTCFSYLLSIDDSEFSEELFLVAHMLQTGHVNGQTLGLCNGRDIVPQESDFEVATNLLCRIVSLVKMQFSSKIWDSVVDRDLMAFNCIYKALHRSLRNLMEMTALNMALKHNVSMPPQDFAEIGFRLPFFSEVNTAMGIVTKSFVRQSNGDLEQLQKQFPSCTNIASDLSRAFRFWDSVMELVHGGKEQSIIPDGVCDQFQQADQLLKDARLRFRM